MVTKFIKKGTAMFLLNTFILAFLITFLFSSCKKLAETPIPTDQVADNAVYSNDATAIAAVTSIFTSLNTVPYEGTQSNFGDIVVNAGLAGDELTVAPAFATSSSIFNKYYQNDLSQVTSVVSGAEHWELFYKSIFRCNAAITGLSSSQADALTSSVRQQLLGEAKFMRAFVYFYLVNEFGDVPLALTTDPQTNLDLPRASKSSVYQQMTSDLLDAESKLSDGYRDNTLLNTTLERVRPNKWAAVALLARVYLYKGEYSNAEQKASLVINNTSLFEILPALNNVFLKNSREAIWQAQPTDPNYNTREGALFVIPATGPSSSGANLNPAYLSKQLLNSFELNDKRKTLGNWVNRTIYQVSSGPVVFDTVYYVYKYKVASSTGVTTTGAMSEYFMVLRLGEQYLIRAEARAKQDNVAGAQSDLNVIRNRAGLANTTASDQSSLLTAILHERQDELFGEWGHRWFDLKRTGNVDAVMSVVTPIKTNGASWRPYQQLFPIPIKDIQTSTNLSQNPGYQ